MGTWQAIATLAVLIALTGQWIPSGSQWLAAGLVAISIIAGWRWRRRLSRPGDTSSASPAVPRSETASSLETLRTVVDASPVAVIAIDAGGEVTLWNTRAAAVFGIAEATAIGRPVMLVAPDPGLAMVWARCATVSLTAVEIDIRDRALAFSTAPLPTGGAVIMAADVTDRKRAAAALAERASQLQRAQKMDVVGRLAGGVAHDFNNLLTVIHASAQMMRSRAKETPDLLGYIDNILSSAQRGSVLSRRLLGFTHRQQLDEKPIELHALLLDLGKLVRSVVGEHVLVEFDLAPPPSTARLDQGQLEQILLNLVLNSSDAMPSGGVLTLRTRTVDGNDPTAPLSSPTGSWVTVLVQDTGTGMTPEVRARVFEPFFTTKPNGTGLGLATAQQIVRGLGGEITVHSQAGIGSTLTLWLPQTDAVAAPLPTELGPPSTDDTATVLLVEDEPALRNLVQILLAEAGYHVLVATSSREALALGSAPGVRIDIMVTDVVMPGLSGPRLAGDLLHRRPDLQVLYMSGYVGDALTELGLDAGANLIHKPFRPERLIQVVREMLDSRVGADSVSAAEPHGAA